MTEDELQKRIAYQFGLINGNIVLPNIWPSGIFKGDVQEYCATQKPGGI